MEAIAKTKYLKGSPQKARLVIDLVRGKNVSRALAILKFTNKRAASPIAKCIRSAVANATYSAEQQNIAIDPDDLWIKTCFVDMGPTKGRKRLRPAPQGRAYQERRHYCHITIELTSDVPETEEDVKPRKKGKKLLAKETAKAAKSEKATKAKKRIKRKMRIKARHRRLRKNRLSLQRMRKRKHPEANRREKSRNSGSSERRSKEGREVSKASDSADKKPEEKKEETPKTEEKKDDSPKVEEKDKTEE